MAYIRATIEFTNGYWASEIELGGGLGTRNPIRAECWDDIVKLTKAEIDRFTGAMESTRAKTAQREPDPVPRPIMAPASRRAIAFQAAQRRDSSEEM